MSAVPTPTPTHQPVAQFAAPAAFGETDLLDRPFAVTFFTNFAAGTKRQEDLSLADLAARIRKASAASKGELPWLKLARFGDVRTDKNSLRHDGNVIVITGVEGDYDGGQVTVEDAVEKLEKGGVLAIVYTSPSHTPAAPRWRVVCPTSSEAAPDRREKMMGRLNGLFVGIFSSESWTLSQGYYYGSVNHNPAHEVHVIDGSPIDELDDLDEIWIGKPNTAPGNGAGGESASHGPLNESELLAAIARGSDYHSASLRLIGSWARAGVSFMDARARVVQAMESVFPPDRDARWHARFADIDRSVEHIYGREARARDEEASQPDPGPETNIERHVEWWLQREMEKPTPLLGEVVTNTSRVFIGGPTGIGKTHLAMAMAAGMAVGTGFAHWRSSHPVRVLYIDGEMARDLVQERLRDIKRRMHGTDLTNLMVVCAEDFECMQPLNTEPGRNFVLGLAKKWNVEVIIFDNRMSLLSGDMKEEQPWTDAMVLVKELSKRRIGQIWIDHTGHDTGKIYGTKTKEWQFDAVALLSKVERPDADVAFQIEFTKARRRRPDTREDFATVELILNADEWKVEGATTPHRKAKLSPMAQMFYEALVNALCTSPTPGRTTKDAWREECVRSELLEPVHEDDTSESKDRKRARFRKYINEIQLARVIGVDGETISILKTGIER